MRKKSSINCLLLLVFIPGALGQPQQRFVVLPDREAKAVALLYPKSGPERVTGVWQPSRAGIENLEISLPQIAELTPKGWPAAVRVEHPKKYYRQYVGVFQGGKKRILVNAFLSIADACDWRNRLVIVSDGDIGFWHAMYDPASQKFSDFEINARA
jgi:hypothetical protein